MEWSSCRWRCISCSKTLLPLIQNWSSHWWFPQGYFSIYFPYLVHHCGMLFQNHVECFGPENKIFLSSVCLMNFWSGPNLKLWSWKKNGNRYGIHSFSPPNLCGLNKQIYLAFVQMAKLAPSDSLNNLGNNFLPSRKLHQSLSSICILQYNAESGLWVK